MNPTLLVVDIQNDYFPKGKMKLVGMVKASENARKILNVFRNKKWPVVFIQHLSTRPDATFFLPNTPGAEIHEAVRPLENETVIVKHFPNSFRNTNLHQHLQATQCSDLVICGAMSHMCIDTTTRAATDLGYKCQLIYDSCATRDLVFNNHTVSASDVHAAYMAALNGMFAQVISTEQFIISSQSK